ncbi:hypothetical protein BH23CHL8_BH23CHL8_19430 [soil metagenome]
MLDPRLPRLPADWTVWAFSDSHGVVSGLLSALGRVGLVDSDGHWSAPPRTALVGCGDYIDRGRDVRGMVALLRRLEREAGDAEGAAVLARGNHEQMALWVHEGRRDWIKTWLRYGGHTTLESFGGGGLDPNGPEQAVAHMEAGQPGIFAWLASLPEAVRWRDILFVHGGLPPDHGPDDLGVTTDEHLWIRSAFYETPWEDGAFERYRHAGIERVVFGHTPQPDGPRLFHGGRSLAIDTNAVGNPGLPRGSQQLLTLVGLAGDGDGTFEGARLVTIDTRGAPDAVAE